MENMKPCPFCGSVPKETSIYEDEDRSTHIVCDNCGASGPSAELHNDEQAMHRWNDRSEHQEQRISTATCDYPECSCAQRWNKSDPEYAECPEHWGLLVLSDALGELQFNYLCPQHVGVAWKLLDGELDPNVCGFSYTSGGVRCTHPRDHDGNHSFEP